MLFGGDDSVSRKCASSNIVCGNCVVGGVPLVPIGDCSKFDMLDVGSCDDRSGEFMVGGVSDWLRHCSGIESALLGWVGDSKPSIFGGMVFGSSGGSLLQ